MAAEHQKKATSFQKGRKAGPGRPPGLPNKSTQNARAAIAMLVEGNIGRMEGWLDEIARTDGAGAAWRCMCDVIEFHIPKLQRTEHAGLIAVKAAAELTDEELARYLGAAKPDA